MQQNGNAILQARHGRQRFLVALEQGTVLALVIH